MTTTRRVLKLLVASAAFMLANAVPAQEGAPGTRAVGSDAVSSEEHVFNVPAESLSRAVLKFSQQADVQLVFGTPVTDGIHSVAINGRYSIATAIGQLLAGTGLTWRWLNARTITIEPSANAPGAHTLGAVRVEGVQTLEANGFANLSGFGSGAGANGSSDVTATEGTGSLTTNGTSVATKIPTSARETAQTVSTVTQARIKEQNLNDLSDALAVVPGLTSVSNGSAGTYLSRGFTITNFSVDGSASQAFAGPNGLVQFTPDLSEYDNVQVLRGSAALFGGAGEPGGLVSLSRKRPLDVSQLVTTVQGGSYNEYRAEVDGSAPIAFDGHLRVRLDGVYQSNDYFYDYSHHTRKKIYAVAEQDLGASTVVRVGGSYQDDHQTAPNTQGLPRYLDGTDPHFSRSTCLCSLSAYHEQQTSEAFVALDHKFAPDWQFNFNAEVNKIRAPSFDQSYTGLLTETSPTLTYYSATQTQYEQTTKTVDGHLSGVYELLGLPQHFVVGADWTDQAFDDQNVFNSPTATTTIDPFNFDPSSFNGATDPSFGIDLPSKSKQWGAYMNLKLNPIKPLHINGGLRVSNYSSVTGPSLLTFSGSTSTFPETTYKENGILSPSIEGIFDVSKWASLFASYNSIYRSQANKIGVDLKPMPPTRGQTYETGVKSSLNDGKLQLSLSYYNTKLTNVALYSTSGATSSCCYTNAGTDYTQGVDLEIAGQLARGWQIQFGYSENRNKVNTAYYQANLTTGYPTTLNSQQPKHQLKFWTSYELTDRLAGLTVGGGLRFESSRFTEGTVCSIAADPVTGECAGTTDYFSFTQPSYAVADLRAGYRFSKNWEGALNITNVTDTRYFTTAGSASSGNYYGEPRAFRLSLKATY